MANAKQHAVVGGAIAAGGYLLFCWLTNRKFGFGDFMFSVGAGCVAGLLPDLLEPAVDPNHRRFFHSVAAAGLLADANRRAWQSPHLTADQKRFVLLASAGYMSHLWLDLQTPRGLPFL